MRVHVHQVQLRIGVVSRHEQILLVFVGGGVCCGRLHGLGQPSEVKFVGVSLPMNFSHDVLVVVISQGPGQFVVVHIGFGFTFSPASGDFVWVHQFEFSVGAFPRDVGCVGRVGQKFQQELPQLDLA